MADWEQQQKQWPTFVIAFSKIGKRFAGIPATTIQQGAMRAPVAQEQKMKRKEKNKKQSAICDINQAIKNAHAPAASLD